ncbi:MAG: hypothetical protein ABIR18_02925, partial [Chitinophagaceae bacterium]
ASAFLFPFLIPKIAIKRKKRLLIFANVSLIIMMLAASIVHLIPAVPASVLPLKIKPPVIPLMFVVISFFNLVNTVRENTIAGINPKLIF